MDDPKYVFVLTGYLNTFLDVYATFALADEARRKLLDKGFAGPFTINPRTAKTHSDS